MIFRTFRRLCQLRFIQGDRSSNRSNLFPSFSPKFPSRIVWDTIVFDNVYRLFSGINLPCVALKHLPFLLTEETTTPHFQAILMQPHLAPSRSLFKEPMVSGFLHCQSRKRKMALTYIRNQRRRYRPAASNLLQLKQYHDHRYGFRVYHYISRSKRHSSH